MGTIGSTVPLDAIWISLNKLYNILTPSIIAPVYKFLCTYGGSGDIPRGLLRVKGPAAFFDTSYYEHADC